MTMNPWQYCRMEDCGGAVAAAAAVVVVVVVVWQLAFVAVVQSWF